MITEKVITEEVSLSPCCLYDAVKTLNDDGHSKRFPEGLHMSTIILIGLHALIWKYILGNWIVLPTPSYCYTELLFINVINISEILLT
jgi:hypothetical protein